ncbi:TPA: hypothetical protein ACF311_004875 [Vibrio parahaemolyticus]|uniref:hypothetical protein n=1 Tax=Vibrio parahaemolyticus TaxID=670 RepID=UPI00111E6FFB|nr:hypothetical protein [Vibrio parahaemolyticus]TOG37974.1 hypothetical protein CGJ02_26280 [Vibrio parahaemolyticus]HBN6206270.1 hypothetical protein [Vibrio parahaemolyticus]HCH4062859.1 hypothetical protein [Vibrio parahaemolyticus]
MLDNNDPWVCQEEDEEDYVIDHFELRALGRKPLILKQPSFSKLMFVTQQYLHTSKTITSQILRTTILNTAEPFTAEEHCRLVTALENHLSRNKEKNR